MAGSCQTTRGCPYACEFCDVVAFLGHAATHKPVDRVLAELDSLQAAGVRQVFISDDNLTVNRRYARELLGAVAERSARWSGPMEFSTQASIDLARGPELMDLCVAAGLRHLFVGVETPNRDSLAQSGKVQNVRTDLVADLRTLQGRGIVVQPGMIVGFDAGGLDIFERQFEFLQEAEVPVPQLGMLNAHHGTALQRRLRAEGRLVEQSAAELGLDTWATNIIPKQMSPKQLRDGFLWLMNRLFRPDTFLARLEALVARLPDLKVPPRSASPEPRGGFAFLGRLQASFVELGADFARAGSKGMRLAGRKPAHAPRILYLLMFYRHLVGQLRRWGVWNPWVGPRPFSS